MCLSLNEVSLKITLVIPTYNEAENLRSLCDSLFSLPLADLNVLVVDDNSPDGTGQLAEDLAKTYTGRMNVMHRAGKQGLGTAYLQGFRQAMAHGAEAIGQMDADFSHPVEAVARLAQALTVGDIALGSRYVAGGRLDDRWPLWRKGLSAWGNFYARTILGLNVRDVTGGFRLWKRNVLESMPLERVKSTGYVFQVETAYLATLLGFKFQEVPIYFADRRWGKSKMSLKIQIEAALRVWELPGRYRDLR
jgi:dolichol-phosphate mannosyltransferase